VPAQRGSQQGQQRSGERTERTERSRANTTQPLVRGRRWAHTHAPPRVLVPRLPRARHLGMALGLGLGLGLGFGFGLRLGLGRARVGFEG